MRDAPFLPKPGAFKADFLRYFLLYSFGGVYGDIKQNYLVPLSSLKDSKYDLLLVRDILEESPGNPDVQISFMIAQKSNLQCFKIALDQITENVYKRERRDHIFSFTGPRLFARALRQSSLVKDKDYKFIGYQHGNCHISSNKHVPIMVTKSLEIRNIPSGVYATQWLNNDLYNNKPIPHDVHKELEAEYGSVNNPKAS